MATTANTTTNILDKILARGLMVLRETCLMPQLVNGDYSAAAAQKGTTIDVPVTRAKSTTSVTPAETPPAPTASVQDLVQIPLDQWEYVDFHLSDKDLAEIDKNRHFMPGELGEAVRALSNSINSNILTKIKQIGNKVVSTGAAFSTATAVADVVAMRKQLKKSLCPTGRGAPLRAVLSLDAEATALQATNFLQANLSGTDVPIREGSIGHFLGFDFYSEDAAPNFTPGTGTGYLVNDAGGLSVGDTTITVDTGSGTILEGDSVYFGTDDTKMYAVATDLSAGSFTIQAPGIRTAVANNAAVTVVGAGTGVTDENVVFHRDCIAFAMRALGDQELDRQANIRTMQDPKTGLVLRLEVQRHFKQWAWTIDALWGARCVRPEFGCRIADVS